MLERIISLGDNVEWDSCIAVMLDVYDYVVSVSVMYCSCNLSGAQRILPQYWNVQCQAGCCVGCEIALNRDHCSEGHSVKVTSD